MSLPSFKFTNIGAPTTNEKVNSGLSTSSKMEKTGILTSIKEKAQDTFKDVSLPELSFGKSNAGFGSGNGDSDSDSESSFFSFWTLIKLILVAVIIWFMWGSLSNNGDFHLGMGELGDKIKTFFKMMEEKGREIISRNTNIELPVSRGDDSDSDSDSEDNDGQQTKPKVKSISNTPHRPPAPPDATNSSDKRPGFLTDDNKYTFLDKAAHIS